jgi:hypothetical protein
VALNQQANARTYFIMGENEKNKLGPGLFLNKRIISGVNEFVFVSNRISYIILSDRSFMS